MDIRQLPSTSRLPQYLEVDLPTVFISECCLAYMDIKDASSILTWASQTFRQGVGVILYEPIGGHDAFGRMMIRNLAVIIVCRSLFLIQEDPWNQFKDSFCLSDFGERVS